MLLTDREVRAAQPRAKPYRLADEGGLYLLVQPSGSKSWGFRYRLNGADGAIGLGGFPDVGLRRARELRDEARVQVAADHKPSGLRRAQAAAAHNETVEAMLRQWVAANENRWSDHFRVEVEGRLAREVTGKIGHMRAADVTTKILMDEVFQSLKLRSHDIAQRVRQHLDHAFVHGKIHGYVTHNPAADVKAALGPKPPNGFRPALIDLDAARIMLGAIEAQSGHAMPKMLNRFQALTAVRPGEARLAAWDEFEDLDSEAPVWRIPEQRMKMRGRGDHVVPLSRQAVEVIRAAEIIRAGKTPWLFPQNPIRPLSDGATNTIIGRAGYRGRHCAHGWRSTFSTTLNELDPVNEPIVEAALAHYKPSVAGRYNRGTLLQQRRRIMQVWADMLLDGLPDASTLLSGPRRA